MHSSVLRFKKDDVTWNPLGSLQEKEETRFVFHGSEANQNVTLRPGYAALIAADFSQFAVIERRGAQIAKDKVKMQTKDGFDFWIYHDEDFGVRGSEVIKALVKYGPFLRIMFQDKVYNGIDNLIHEQSFGIFNRKYLGVFNLFWDSFWYLTELQNGLPSSRNLGPASFGVTIPKVCRTTIYCMATGPYASSVQVYTGCGDGPVVVQDGHEYVFAKVISSDPKLIDVPMAVKANWLRHYAFSHTEDKVKKSEKSFYEQHNAEYAMWSFPIHAAQVKTILATFPSETVVIAPADGIGLVARTWGGKTICGDRVVDLMSEPSVAKENIEQTLLRITSLSKEEKPAVVLSYAGSFLKPDHYAYLQAGSFPVYFLDLHVPPLENLRKIGFGVWALRPFSECLIPCLPENNLPAKVVFTENLLRNEGYTIFREGGHYQYFRAMRPMARIQWVNGVKPPIGEGSAPLVLIEGTRDLLDFQLIDHWRSEIYFAPLGKKITRIHLCTIEEENLTYVNVAFEAGQVYSCREGTPLSFVVGKSSAFYTRPEEKRIYFFSHSPICGRASYVGEGRVVEGSIIFNANTKDWVSGGFAPDGTFQMRIGIKVFRTPHVPFVQLNPGLDWLKGEYFVMQDPYFQSQSKDLWIAEWDLLSPLLKSRRVMLVSILEQLHHVDVGVILPEIVRCLYLEKEKFMIEAFHINIRYGYKAMICWLAIWRNPVLERWDPHKSKIEGIEGGEDLDESTFISPFKKAKINKD